jgi:hypothetical protein
MLADVEVAEEGSDFFLTHLDRMPLPWKRMKRRIQSR